MKQKTTVLSLFSLAARRLWYQRLLMAHTLLPTHSAAENIGLVLRLAGMDRKAQPNHFIDLNPGRDQNLI